MLFVFYTVVFAFHIYLLLKVVLSAPVNYDQRQTGELNVRIDLKDLKVLAFLDSKILEDYTDYDYFYDFADFTSRPISKPTSVSTVESLNTESTNAPAFSSTIKTDSTGISSTNDSIITTSKNGQSIEDATASTIEEDRVISSSNKEGLLETSRLPLRKRAHLKIRSNNRPKFVSSK
ncbi:PREDICTED: uncharacterized protein LOC107065786 [Polistes dominula]|uniref:Uncharacterized protein LOC107065786 n=1 Tax=Polistes dominula TaxID=743375 RepID=A0ABM1I4W8_POLDO|nr:PREDICTED: uncharacterized protein LOC107065786 [Polistes dominula]